MKPLNFGLVFLLFLSDSLIFFTSGLKPNSALETSIACQKDSDCVGVTNALCNTNRKCQCNFPYAPISQEVGVLDACKPKECNYDGVCTELYRDPNATCSEKRCGCQEGFVFNEERQQCEYADPEIRALGAACDNADQCGPGANCALDTGYCRCDFGFLPANNITCKLGTCVSDAQCRGRIPNSLCWYVGATRRCICDVKYTNEFTGDSCVPETRKIGQSCHNLDPRYKCGRWFTICAENVCRCQSGSLPKKDGFECDLIHCEKDIDCKASDINSVCNGSGGCTCPYEYNIDETTQLCVKVWRLDSGWIVAICFAAIVFFCTVGIVASKAVFGWKVPSFHD